MHVELLQAIPISGSVHERHFEVSAGANAWAKFTDDSGVEWVGVFGSGEPSRFHAAIPFGDDDGRTVLVIAGGRGYVVDAATGDLIRRAPWHYSKAAIAVPDRGFVVVADDTQIWAASRRDDRGAWRREPAWYDYGLGELPERMALDGIIFDRAAKDEVRGKVWDGDGWYAFRLLVPDLEFTREEFIAPDWESFAST